MTQRSVNEISNAFVRDLAAMVPSVAVDLGLPSDRLVDDLSPEGRLESADLCRRALAELATAPIDGEGDAVARDVIAERATLFVDRYEAGDTLADLNVIASPLQELRMVFDLLPNTTDDDLESIAARMEALPQAFAGYKASLAQAAGTGRVAALRQVDKCAEQCDAYSGAGAGEGFFAGLAAAAGRDGALGVRLAATAAIADGAYADFGQFLRSELRAQAPERDAVGPDIYSRASRDFLGATVDLLETYRWGWEEFLSLEADLIEVAGRINPAATPREVADQLDADARYQVTGTDGLQRWMQDLSDGAIAQLGRTHFDIPEPLRSLDCKIAPPGGGVGAYYTGPNDDLTRPGAMWWSVEAGREVFGTWREVTAVYHEGVPGHHLQIGTATYQRDSLNDFQRLVAGTSGHAEGWALYAERLVRELGYLDDDGDLLGMLDAQLFRAARVVIDIGMHLELEIPTGTKFHEGERWTPDLGLEFLLTRTISDPAHSADEIDRYLGWPGQAPSYKVGERIWIAGRDAAKALQFGGMGLDPLSGLLATI